MRGLGLLLFGLLCFVLCPRALLADARRDASRQDKAPKRRASEETKTSQKATPRRGSDPAPRRARPDPLAPGVRLCVRYEWEKASAFFLAQKKKLHALARRDRARVYLFLGVSYANLLQRGKSNDAFVRALLLDPCIQLPTQLDLSPQIKARFSGLSRPFALRCRQRQKASGKTPGSTRKEPPRGRPPARVPDPKAQQKSKAWGIRLAAWVVLGAGAAAAATAGVFGGMAVLDELSRNEQPFTEQGTSAYLEFDRRARERAFLANVLFGAAGALLFTGFALHLSQWLGTILPPELIQVPEEATSRTRVLPAHGQVLLRRAL